MDFGLLMDFGILTIIKNILSILDMNLIKQDNNL
jgi:hypothetical protein